MQTGIRRNFNSKRLIAIGDVHGCIDLLKDLIENQIQFRPHEDVLVFLGDYIDRGKTDQDERETLNYMRRLRAKNQKSVILLKGNHEDMAQLAIKSPFKIVKFGGYNEPARESKQDSEFMFNWKQNGAKAAYWNDSDKQKLLNFIESLPLYLLTDDFLFVHAGADNGLDIHKQATNDLLWNRYNFERYKGRKLIIGHTPTKDGKVRFEANRIMVDTGAFFSGILSAVDVLSNEVYQSRRRQN